MMPKWYVYSITSIFFELITDEVRFDFLLRRPRSFPETFVKLELSKFRYDISWMSSYCSWTVSSDSFTTLLEFWANAGDLATGNCSVPSSCNFDSMPMNNEKSIKLCIRRKLLSSTMILLLWFIYSRLKFNNVPRKSWSIYRKLLSFITFVWPYIFLCHHKSSLLRNLVYLPCRLPLRSKYMHGLFLLANLIIFCITITSTDLKTFVFIVKTPYIRVSKLLLFVFL